MATFVLLVNWTDQGIRSFEDTGNRADSTAELATRFGAQLTQTYWTLGAYDLVAVVEAPSAEKVAAFTLALGSSGDVRTLTLPAFDQKAMSAVIDDAKIHGGKIHGGRGTVGPGG